MLVLIDDFSRKTWIYFLTEKGETFDMFKRFKSRVEKEVGKYICCLRTDRGGEFTSNSFNQFCEEHGIRRQLTAAYTPQQNGVAGRRNRTIMNMVRCLLTEKEMPKKFWPEAARWTSHVLNRSLTSAVNDMVPEECWSGVKPSVDHFSVVGCIGHVHIPEQHRIKLDNKSHKCILLGISEESKAYRLFDPISNKIVINRDVIFEEEGKWDWKTAETESKSDILACNDEGRTTEGEHEEEVEADREEQQEEQPATADPDSENSDAPDFDPEMPQRRNRRRPAWMHDYESGA
jgi:hypothetical protein